MTKQRTAGVQPSVLRWARETLGMSLPEVAQRLKRPIAEIEAWEAGAEAPTYPQLEKLAYSIHLAPTLQRGSTSRRSSVTRPTGAT